MADSEIPKTLGDAVLKVLWNSLPFILLLISLERLVEEKYWQAAVLFVAFVLNLVIVVQWEKVAALWAVNRYRRHKLLAWILIVIGGVTLAAGIGLLAKQSATPLPPSSNIAPDQTELDDARKQLQAERDGRAVLDRQLAATRKELQHIQSQRDAAVRAAADANAQIPPQNAAPSSGPIAWEQNFFWGATGGGKSALMAFVYIRGKNVSSSAVQLKNGKLSSGLTGRELPLLVNVANVGATPIYQINPLPRGATVDLIVEWNPGIPIREFIDQWKQMLFRVEYDDTTYEKSYDENYIMRKVISEYPEAGFGPHVTIKSDK